MEVVILIRIRRTTHILPTIITVIQEMAMAAVIAVEVAAEVAAAVVVLRFPSNIVNRVRRNCLYSHMQQLYIRGKNAAIRICRIFQSYRIVDRNSSFFSQLVVRVAQVVYRQLVFLTAERILRC